MDVLRDLGQRLRQMAAPLAGFCIVAYFGYHAVQGERGIVTWLQFSQQIEQTEAALAVSRAEERRLEHRVSLLRPGSLDPDMLDERARAVLNLARPEERVIFLIETGAVE